MDSLSYIDSTLTSPRRAHHVKVSACGGIFLHPWVAQGRRHRRGLLPHLLIASWAFILFFFFFFFKRNISTCDTQCGRKGSALFGSPSEQKDGKATKTRANPACKHICSLLDLFWFNSSFWQPKGIHNFSLRDLWNGLRTEIFFSPDVFPADVKRVTCSMPLTRFLVLFECEENKKKRTLHPEVIWLVFFLILFFFFFCYKIVDNDAGNTRSRYRTIDDNFF